jgi:hypothetical protein
MKFIVIHIIFFCSCLHTHSQVRSPGLLEDRLDFQTQSFKAHTDHANMILNITNGDFFLSFDVATLKTGDTKVDSTLAAIGEQIVVYRANISESIFLFNQDIGAEKERNMQGVLVANGIETPCVAQFHPKSLSDKNDVRSYRMDFKLSVDAGKVSITGLENKLLKELTLQVLGGRLNIRP